jgi:hypothetical protein
MKITEAQLRTIIRLTLLEARVHSPEFDAWFGDSVLRLPDGSPMRLYHGTKSKFSVFRSSAHGKYGPGIYLSGSPLEASGYAMSNRNSEGDGGTVMPLYARLENPLTLIMQSDGSMRIMTRDGYLTPEHEALQDKMSTVKGAVEAGAYTLTGTAKRLGHDGLIIDLASALGPAEMQQLAEMDPDTAIEELLHQVRHVEVVLFSPSQVKSASGNVGTWSTDEEDISLEQ